MVPRTLLVGGSGAGVARRTALERHRDRLGDDLGRGVAALSGRDDLVLQMRWDGTAGDVVSWVDLAAREVHINGDLTLGGVHPRTVHPLTPAGRVHHPALIGVCCHAAAHARSTRWVDVLVEGSPPMLVAAASLLEEVRVEYRHLQERPQDRQYLRAASRLVGFPSAVDATAVADRWRAGALALRTYARMDGHVLTADDAAPVIPVLTAALGEPLLNELRDVWVGVLGVADDDPAGVLAAAAEWCRLLGATDDVASPSECYEASVRPPGPPAEPDEWDDPDSVGEGEGGEGWDDPLGDAFSLIVSAAAADAADTIRREWADLTAGNAAAEAAAVAAQKQRAANRAVAETVFDGDGTALPVVSRPPSAQEQVLAYQIGQALKRATFRDRQATLVYRETPPGRLDGRAAMQRHAQRSMRMQVTAKPFRATVHRHTPTPPLSLGIMCDKSGSMGWAEPIIASMTWVLANAARTVQGRVAAVTFGNSVTALARPGRIPTLVTEFKAVDGAERFHRALSAIDGALPLTGGRGARILTIISDGCYTSVETEHAARLVPPLVADGVLVLWMSVTPVPHLPRGAVPVLLGDLDRVPGLFTDALTTALHTQP